MLNFLKKKHEFEEGKVLKKAHDECEQVFAENEKNRITEHKRIIEMQNASICVGEGFDLDKRDTSIKLMIPNEDRNSHMWVWGTTRQGKSKLAESIIEQDIRSGKSVVYMDPKGDQSLFDKIAFLAMATGREEDLMLVTPIFPELSAIIDPLASYYMPEELVSHIVSGVPMGGGDSQFFYNVALRTAMAIVQALIVLAQYAGKQPTFNLKEVEQYVSYDGLTKLREHVRSLEKNPSVLDVLHRLDNLLATPQDYFSKVATGLEVALSELTTGHVGRIIGKADENRFLKRMEEGKGVILVVQLGSMLTQRAAYTAGKVILSMIQSFVGRTLASGRTVFPQLCIHIDEAHNVINPAFSTLISMCGGANVKLHCYNQSISQLYDAVGEDLAHSIVDNANTKIFLRVPDFLTANFISKHLGEKNTWSPILTHGGSITIRETEDVRIKPSEVMSLSPREFFLQTYSGLYRGKTLDVAVSPLKVRFPIPATIRKIK